MYDGYEMLRRRKVFLCERRFNDNKDEDDEEKDEKEDEKEDTDTNG